MKIKLDDDDGDDESRTETKIEKKLQAAPIAPNWSIDRPDQAGGQSGPLCLKNLNSI